MSTETIEVRNPCPQRERLPETRPAITHKFEIADQDGYIVVGLYFTVIRKQKFVIEVDCSAGASTCGGTADL